MKILALGTCCVDVYTQKEITTPGGEALNIAVQLSTRKDLQVYLMGMIGNDEYGSAVLDSVRHRDINLDHVYQVDGETAHHIIQIARDGDRFFEEGAWHGGVSADLSLNDHDRSLLGTMDGVMTTLWEPNLKELVALKPSNKYLLAVDFNEQRDFTQWEPLMDGIDVFFSSATDSMKAIFEERSKSSETIFVLTFGEHGSVAFHQGRTFQCPAVKVANVVDTTGCGDCYQGHFVAEYLKTGDIQHSMDRAVQEASKVTAYVGGFPN